MFARVSLAELLLDPDFWKCAGKSLGWCKAFENDAHPAWKDIWHQLITHLADGHDINSALEAVID